MEEHATNTPAPAPKNKTLFYATLVIVALVALGVGYHFIANVLPQYTNGDAVGGDGADSGPVAVVNGEEIPRETYEQAYAQYRAAFGQPGSGVTDEQLKQQTVNDLVNSFLLKQAALAGGYSATDAAVDAEINAIIEGSGGAESFATQIAQAGLTEAEVRQQVAEQLAINTYLQEALDIESITVTDEEVTAFYDEVSAANDTIPALEEVRAQIEQQLKAQKQQERVATLITELRADATIEILI